jgi:hypothetical protein
VSPFQYEYTMLNANVCGRGTNAELRMTCRGRSSILGPQQVWAQVGGVLAQGHFWGMRAMLPGEQSSGDFPVGSAESDAHNRQDDRSAEISGWLGRYPWAG